MLLRVAKAPNESLALKNCLILNPEDVTSNSNYALVEHAYAFNIIKDKCMKKGEVGTSGLQRQWACLSVHQEVDLEFFDPLKGSLDCYIGKLVLQIDFLKKSTVNTNPYDTDVMAKIFHTSYDNQIFTQQQALVFDFHGTNLIAEVIEIELVHLQALASTTISSPPVAHKLGFKRGILMNQSDILFVKSPESALRLTGSTKSSIRSNAIISPNFRFEDIGIGGLDEEFSIIFRRAFASRIFPPSLAEKLGISHVKGMLLYGPPGTGKTLIARQIGSMLNAREPQVINGPEVLNKFVGESEKRIRELFEPAEKEYKAKGEDSHLHIIIFDELDAICKQRGSKSDSTGVGDSIVNQLLSKMDGVNQLNNILIIGMTNRIDLIDEALVRPGRFEVQMEISLPDEKGRLDILKIHTSKMKENQLLQPDVHLDEIAHLTPNYSGAELTGVIKSAASFAFNRHVKVGTLATISDDVDNLQVTKDDFMNAIAEVRPAYGVSSTDFDMLLENGFIAYSIEVQKMLDNIRILIQKLQSDENTHLISLLLHGPANSGKSALASKIALDCGFPFVKLVSPTILIGMNEMQVSNSLHKIFTDAYKSNLSMVILDDIETIIEYAPIGPRFSNAILITLGVLLKQRPPKGRKLFIIATTTLYNLFSQLDFTRRFTSNMYVSNIEDLGSLLKIAKDSSVFNETQLMHLEAMLQDTMKPKLRLSIGIKKFYFALRTASVVEDDIKVETVINDLISNGLFEDTTTSFSNDI